MWNEMIKLSESLQIVFEGHCGFGEERGPWDEGHKNLFFSSNKLEMGHISIIDKRESKGMWMMHVCAFAKPEYPMPIYGFDVICGKNKITGCFHDMSPTVTTDQTKKIEENYVKLVEYFIPERERPLPEWAQEIFSDKMLAVGNVTKKQEISALVFFGMINLNVWFSGLNTVNKSFDQEVINAHEMAKSKYCFNQLQNVNSKNVMVSLGLKKSYVDNFKKIQFPY